MSSAEDIAKGFTITGLLDASAKTQRRYPVVEIPLSDIADHPENVSYSMDEAGIARLADSIREHGLTDLPLVRKLEDGTYQMVSGHRRKAAYALLSKENDGFAKIPCRVADGIDDEASVMMLHAANYFTRTLSITERAAATRALCSEVERRRAEDRTLSGMRTEDVKASILAEQTGRKVSGKTIKRQEALAELIETRLIDAWRTKADEGLLSAYAIESLSELSEAAQVMLYDELPEGASGKSELSRFVTETLSDKRAEEAAVESDRELEIAMRETVHPHADTRLKLALTSLKAYFKEPPEGPVDADLKAASLLRCLSDHLPKAESKETKKTKGRLRHA